MIDTFIGCSLACPICAHLCYRMYAFQKTYFQYFTGSRNSTMRPLMMYFVMKTLFYNFFIFFPETIFTRFFSFHLHWRLKHLKLKQINWNFYSFSQTFPFIQRLIPKYRSIHLFIIRNIHINTILEFLNKTWLQMTIQVNSPNCSLAWKYWDWLELHSFGILDFSK